MASYNKVTLLGNLVRDPEMRQGQSGDSICKFSIATSREFKRRDGTMQKETTYVDVDAFGRQAEIIFQFLKKGRPILLDGRLRLDQWETPSGEKRSKLCVVLENFQFIGGRQDEDGGHFDEEAAPIRSKGSAIDPNAYATHGSEDVPF